MNKKLDQIRASAIEIREQLSYAKPDDQKKIAKLDKIIRGAVIVKWMHLLAVVFFIVYTAVFIYLMYPDAKAMFLTSSFAAAGYAISWIGIVIQIKIYNHTIGKVQSIC